MANRDNTHIKIQTAQGLEPLKPMCFVKVTGKIKLKEKRHCVGTLKTGKQGFQEGFRDGVGQTI